MDRYTLSTGCEAIRLASPPVRDVPCDARRAPARKGRGWLPPRRRPVAPLPAWHPARCPHCFAIPSVTSASLHPIRPGAGRLARPEGVPSKP